MTDSSESERTDTHDSESGQPFSIESDKHERSDPDAPGPQEASEKTRSSGDRHNDRHAPLHTIDPAIIPAPHSPDITEATWQGFVGIAAAGAVYAAVVILFVSLVSIAASSFRGLVTWTGIVFFPVALSIGIAIGFLYAGLLGICSTLLVTIFNWTMGYHFKPSTAGAIAGGMAGYFATCSVLFSPAPIGYVALTFLFGPLLAMLMGQTGAVYLIRYNEVADNSKQLNRANQLRKELHAIVALYEDMQDKKQIRPNQERHVIPDGYVHPLDREDEDEQSPGERLMIGDEPVRQPNETETGAHDWKASQPTRPGSEQTGKEETQAEKQGDAQAGSTLGTQPRPDTKRLDEPDRN